MSIKAILAPLLGESADRQTLNAALTIARATDGHVQAVFFHCDPRDAVSPQIGDGMSGGMIDSLMQVAQEQAEVSAGRARQAYDAWQRDNHVAATPNAANTVTARFLEVKGDLVKELTRYGRLADIICTVRGGDGADQETIFESALMASGKMVLHVPPDTDLSPVRHVAVAWNGSREAARAVALAMPVLEAADNVTVLAGTSNVVTPEDVNLLCESLKWHGIDAAPRLFTPSGARMSQDLQSEAEMAGAQLLLLGAYSHSRLRETVFGGVTDDIVKECRLPVLMAH